MDDILLEAIITIANHQKVKALCEPNIMGPKELKVWMVMRTLVAISLFQEEWERQEKGE